MVLRWRSESGLREQLAGLELTASTTCIVAHTQLPGAADWMRVAVVPHDAEAFARALYAELHQCDELNATAIIVEALPDSPEWRAIADRLNRAAAAHD